MNRNWVRRMTPSCRKDLRRREIEQQLMSKQGGGHATLEMPPKTKVVGGRSMSAHLADTRSRIWNFSLVFLYLELVLHLSFFKLTAWGSNQLL